MDFTNNLCRAEVTDKRDEITALEVLKTSLENTIQKFHDDLAGTLRRHDVLEGPIAEEMIFNLREWVDYSDFFEPLERETSDKKAEVADYE